MKKMTKLKLSFTSIAFALPLALHADDTPQTGDMTSNSMTATNPPQTSATANGHSITEVM